MNDMSGAPVLAEDGASPSFSFTGNWREFLPIALTNLVLTVVTLGIYRFWAKARERRYLWSRTHFIDDSFEWTGTGKEMFLGFLIVMAVLLPTFLIVSTVAEGFFLRGDVVTGGLIMAALYGALFYFYHVAVLRSLRYRLSRTWWHGIRGGSDEGGWSYGVSGMWKTILGVLTLGLLIPWSMTRLWNERWNQMSYGPHRFEANASSEGLMGRWLLIYLAPVVAIALMALGGGVAAFMGDGNGTGIGTAVGLLFAGILFFYVILLFASLSYYAAFYRHVAQATSVAGLKFEFTARTKDWLKLILGNIGLVIVTLGVGLLFLAYRNWKFVVRHMEARGTVDLELLTQSQTRAPSDAEGLADAFDIGAV